MIFSRTWEEHLEHLEAVFKWLEAANLKIKHSKCEVFKTKVHYLHFLVGIDGVQPLPEKVAIIQVSEPPRDINELRKFTDKITAIQSSSSRWPGDIFQRKIDNLFKELSNVFEIADDILVVGYDDDGMDHDYTLRRVLLICWKVNLKLNKDECHFRYS